MPQSKGYKRVAYSPLEMEYIRDNALTLKYYEIAAHLGRLPSSISRKLKHQKEKHKVMPGS